MNRIIEHNASSWSYQSGRSVWSEQFAAGKLIFSGMSDTGSALTPTQSSTTQPSFDLIIDGQSLNGGFVFGSFVKTDAEAVLTLTHALLPVRVMVRTRCCEAGFFERAIDVTNTSPDATLMLSDATPLSGRIWTIKDNTPENMAAVGGAPYSIGRFIDSMCFYEGNFSWQDVHVNSASAYRSTHGRSGWNNPFFILRNNIVGGYFMCQLGWSGDWMMHVQDDFTRTGGGGDSKLTLGFKIKPDGPAPLRLIAPGETVALPSVHLGAGHRDLDDLIQSCHRSLRHHILRRWREGAASVYFGVWGLDEAELMDLADLAAELGSEYFVIDAEWYGDKSKPWWDFTGDWYTVPERYPHDLFAVFEKCRRLGIKCGLWMEIESAGKYSKTAKEHPDWIETRDGVKITRKLDLTVPKARDFVKSEMVRAIEKYKLDLIRTDFNIDTGDGGNRVVNIRPFGGGERSVSENLAWRNVEEIYKIFDEMRDLYPDVEFENCAGGGGRTDIGMVRRFNTTWVSDWMRLPRAARILNGMTMVLPPEYVNRQVGFLLDFSIWGDLDTQMHVGVLGHMSLAGGPADKCGGADPEAVATIRKYVDLYKERIRGFLPECLTWHHFPEVKGLDANGWYALEHSSQDRTEAVAGVFRLPGAKEDVYTFRFRGVDPGRRYSVTQYPGDAEFEADGLTLMESGLRIMLDTALTSRLLLAKAV